MGARVSVKSCAWCNSWNVHTLSERRTVKKLPHVHSKRSGFNYASTCVFAKSKRRSDRTKRESTFPFARPDRKESNSQVLANLPFRNRFDGFKSESTFRFDHVNDDRTEPKGKALANLPIQTGDPKEQNWQALANLPIQNSDPKKPNRKALSDLALQTTIRPNQKGKHFPFCPSRSEGVKFASACEFATAEQIRWIQIGKHFPIWPCKPPIGSK